MFSTIEHHRAGSGNQGVMRIRSPPDVQKPAVSRPSGLQVPRRKRLKRPCQGWKPFGHAYPRLAPWATFNRPLRGLGSSATRNLTDGLGTRITEAAVEGDKAGCGLNRGHAAAGRITTVRIQGLSTARWYSSRGDARPCSYSVSDAIDLQSTFSGGLPLGPAHQDERAVRAAYSVSL